MTLTYDEFLKATRDEYAKGFGDGFKKGLEARTFVEFQDLKAPEDASVDSDAQVVAPAADAQQLGSQAHRGGEGE